ncbi:hypothetical protein EIN_095100 [Entamoeba invadens IP1]|uniref:Uncharacterized protein n=1 Tax=Entamoeba invadens IP1 TaxID=370355 RepID=A0A0A1U3E5_ENTIV|nr:hypothetical protein EIN_095100 [Entamoeba invadens IP1]ELP87273.1 hypothetical protein EIN_095100 [Entamoeba invadens IP1]|eukprot:XP_004254044.1 hypothetical protein EIN_095100 [Entamoeba invadens IP1]
MNPIALSLYVDLIRENFDIFNSTLQVLELNLGNVDFVSGRTIKLPKTVCKVSSNYGMAGLMKLILENPQDVDTDTAIRFSKAPLIPLKDKKCSPKTSKKSKQDKYKNKEVTKKVTKKKHQSDFNGEENLD